MRVALIVGCARSGTSILGELIAAHPDVTYIFEAHQVWELGGLGVNDSHRLTAEHATARVIGEVRRWFEAQQGPATLLVEKNPRNVLRVPYVRAVLPEARLLHIVRDGRDVACSMVPGCGGAEWSHLKPPSWKELLARHEGAVRCALAWKEVMEIALEDLAGVPHLQLRYEDLLNDPDAEARRVLAFLDLAAHPAVAAFCARIQDATAGSYHAQHQDRWYRADHRFRVGRWRENLTEEEQERITALLSPLLQRLGYR